MPCLVLWVPLKIFYFILLFFVSLKCSLLLSLSYFSFPFLSIFHSVCSIFCVFIFLCLFCFWRGGFFRVINSMNIPVVFLSLWYIFVSFRSPSILNALIPFGTLRQRNHTTGASFSPQAPNMFHHRIYSREFSASVKGELHSGCKILGTCTDRTLKLATLYKT
jgi:hypothetical protein